MKSEDEKIPMKEDRKKQDKQDNNQSKFSIDWRKKQMISFLCITLLVAGFGCLALPVKLSWISGILFLLVGIAWGYSFWLSRIKGTGTLDRELSRGMWSQLSLLFGAVAIAFLVGMGLLLLFHHDFDDNYTVRYGYDAFIYIAHRYLGYNFYNDGNVTNTFIFVFSLIGTVLVGGLLITTLSNIVQQRKEDIDLGVAKYKLRGHTVIIGFGDYATHIAKNALKDEKAVVALMTNQNMPKVRSRLRVELPASYLDRLYLISGEMTTDADIDEKLSLPEAKDVYVLGEAKEFGVDSKCIECVKYISKARGEKEDVLPVYVHLQHLYSNKYIKSADKPSPVKDAKNIFFRPFCFYENWSRLLWSYYALPKYQQLDFKPIDEKTHVHLVIVGLNRMGAALVLQAARLSHFPNFVPQKNNTIISIIERDSSVVDEFKSMYPGLLHLEDVDIRFEENEGKYHTFESFSPEIDKYAKDPSTLLTIAICYRDPDEAISAALRLPESVYYQPGLVAMTKNEANEEVWQNNTLTQVLIRQEVDYGLGHIIDTDNIRYKNFHTFGMFDEGLNLDLFDDTIPMIAKNNYVQMGDGTFVEQARSLICRGSIALEEYISSLREDWRNSKEWDRMSNRYQIDIFRTYLSVLTNEGLLKNKDNSDDWDIDDYVSNGFYKLIDSNQRPKSVPAYDQDLANRIASIEHRRWNAERQIAGWRAPNKGETRLDKFYIHPNIIAFDELDVETKKKDIIVLRAVPFMDAIKQLISNNHEHTVHPHTPA